VTDLSDLLSSRDTAVSHIIRMTGLSVPSSRHKEVAMGIRRVMARHGISDVDELVGRLGSEPELLDALVTEMTVQETYFFRDPEQFEAIRTVVLPSLLAERPDSVPIRIWSAGCSSGEEPYSLAILMEEEGLAERAQITATDISMAALQKARNAEYGEWSLRDEVPGLADRYFSRHGRSLRLDGRFRKRVSFGFLNLESHDFPSFENGTADLDLILCRNVLIYLGMPSVRRIARKLFACLAGGGWLVIGSSDPPLWEHAPFITEMTPSGVLYQRPMKSAIPGGAVPKPERVETGLLQVKARQPSSRTVTRPIAKAEPARSSFAGSGNDAGSFASNIRALLQSGDTAVAVETALVAVKTLPLSPELHYLEGVAFIAAGRADKAAPALRRAIYLDRTLAAAHYLLGSVLQDRNVPAALRAFNNAADLCDARPSGEIVRLMEGDTAGRLAQLVKQRIAALSQTRNGAP